MNKPDPRAVSGVPDHRGPPKILSGKFTPPLLRLFVSLAIWFALTWLAFTVLQSSMVAAARWLVGDPNTTPGLFVICGVVLGVAFCSGIASRYLYRAVWRKTEKILRLRP
jgi:hypothetical protein